MSKTGGALLPRLFRLKARRLFCPQLLELGTLFVGKRRCLVGHARPLSFNVPLSVLQRGFLGAIRQGRTTDNKKTTRRFHDEPSELVVEMKGFEPSASALRTLRSPS